VNAALLLAGAASAVVFCVVLVVEGARRPGYDPRYHTGRELELGARGWIQRVNFYLAGAGFVAFAVGVGRTLDTVAGGVLLGLAGLALVLAGVFAPDPVRGFPPRASTRTNRPETLPAKIHDLTGPLLALALLGACLAIARRLSGGWALYTGASAAVGLLTTAWLITAYRRDAAHAGLVQRGLIGTYWLWVALLGTHLTLTT
jgi:hypothetical protein